MGATLPKRPIVIIRDRRPKEMRVHHITKESVMVERMTMTLRQLVTRPTVVKQVHIRHRRIREDPNSESTSWVRKWLCEEEYFDKLRKKKVWGVMRRDVTEEVAKRWLGVL